MGEQRVEVSHDRCGEVAVGITEMMKMSPDDSDNDELKQYYLDAWKKMLHAFLGWPEERVLAWVEDTRDAFLDNPLLGHETAMYYVSSLLVPEALKATLGLGLIHLANRLEKAIGQGELWPAFGESYDWDAARRRLQTILNEYGHSLPREEG